MSLYARQDAASFVLEKLTEHLKQPTHFDRNSTAFDMGVDQTKRDMLVRIKHYEERYIAETRNKR